MTQDILINAQHISRHYGGFVAVDDVSFEVRRGEVVGFLGPNGAGKSTTMQIITGNLAPTLGKIEINGIDILDQPKLAKVELGYLPEQPPLYRDATVDEFLRFCAKLNLVAKTRIDKALDHVKQRCGLGEVGAKLIGSLSKGFQQRVGIAQAIIHNPMVVILDEPTVGLDPIQIREIRNLVRELGSDHSVILSTHILPEVQSTCDRVQIIHHGRIVLSESIDGLTQKMQSSQTIIALNNPPSEFTAIESLPGVDFVESAGDTRYNVHHHPDHNPAEAIVALAVERQWGLYELVPHRMSLEEIFVDITHEEFDEAMEVEHP
jgi:ABC-2 type transport system ATP-binding protein